MNTKLKKAFWYISYFIVAAGYIFYLSKHQVYNSDMLSYMGVVVEYSVKDPKVIHQTVYSIAKKEVSQSNFIDLISRNEARNQRFHDYKKFYDYLTYFRLKPLYTLIVFSLYKLGVRFTIATYIPSLISTLGLLLLFFHWLRKYLNDAFAFLISTMVMLLSSINEIACWSTPDALSNFINLYALYLIMQNNRSWKLHLTLLLCILTRLDNAIFVFVYYLISYNFLKDLKKSSFRLILVLILSAVAVLFIPVLSGNNIDWMFQFNYLFNHHDYIHLIDKATDQLRAPSYLIMIILLLLLLYFNQFKKIYLVLFITLVIHFILFPSIEERFYVAYRLFIIIGLIDSLQQLKKRIKPQMNYISDSVYENY